MGCSSSVSTNHTQSSSNRTIQVFGSLQSTSTRIVLTTLIEKGLKYELKLIDLKAKEQKEPEYVRDKQPFGLVPVLIDEDGYQIYESRAICRYLEQKYKGKGTELIPSKDPQAEGLFEQAASIETSYFNSNVGPLIYEKWFKKKMTGVDTDEETVKQLKATVNDKFDVYEKLLTNQPYLAGQTFTLADLFHLPFGAWLGKINEENLITSRPHMKEWWEKISSRSSWKTVQAMGPMD